MLIDTHAHLNFAAFDKDREKVIERCLKSEVLMINVGTNFLTSEKAVKIAEKYPKGVYAAIGLHPLNLDTGLIKIKLDKNEVAVDAYGKKLDKVFEKQFDYEKYKKLGENPKVVTIGEIGLDYYYKPKTKRKLEIFKQKQKELLLEEIKLAEELNLPIIFHCRMAHEDLIKELQIRNYELGLKGVIHSFTGTWQQAKKFLEMGFYLGFNGIIFKRIEGIDFEEIIKKTPLERILIETDCPFLTPAQAKADRNEPIFVKYVAQKIAEIKNESFEKIAEITLQNAKRLFKIDPR